MYICELDLTIETNLNRVDNIIKFVDELNLHLNACEKFGTLSNESLEEYDGRLKVLLFELADLSLPLFAIGNDLYDYYLKCDNIKGYNTNYSKYHRPFNVGKNKIYYTLEKIEKLNEKEKKKPM